MAVRDFKPDLVPNVLVNRILESGRLAPSSDNFQPWQFIVIKNKSVLESAVRIGGIRSFVATAPMAIGIAMENYDRPLLDAGRALQQMQLTAWSDGVGSCFVGIPPNNISDLKKFLHIPDELELISIMPFGFPREGNKGGRKRRKQLSEMTHSDIFGSPYTSK